MIKETLKIKIKEGLDFNKREKYVNTEIQKTIDLYNSDGFVVIDHQIANKTNTYATVNFFLKKMIRI
jgi:hypothetical protein